MDREYYDLFEYDVALSFAAEDRSSAEELGSLLASNHIRVFYDPYQPDDPWGKDVVDHLVNLYARKARVGVVFISQSYPLRKWTEQERKSARERAFRDPVEYILLLRLDDTQVPGMMETKSTRDLRQESMESIVRFLEEKLAQIRSQAGPPSRSHDLRSGNIPSTHDERDQKDI